MSEPARRPGRGLLRHLRRRQRPARRRPAGRAVRRDVLCRRLLPGCGSLSPGRRSCTPCRGGPSCSDPPASPVSSSPASSTTPWTTPMSWPEPNGGAPSAPRRPPRSGCPRPSSCAGTPTGCGSCSTSTTRTSPGPQPGLVGWSRPPPVRCRKERPWPWSSRSTAAPRSGTRPGSAASPSAWSPPPRRE